MNLDNTSYNIEQIGQATKTHGFISNKNLTTLLWKFHRKNKTLSRSMSVSEYQAKAKSIVDEIIESKELYRPNWFGKIPNVKVSDIDNPKQTRQIKNHNKKHIPITLHNKNSNHSYDCYYHFSILPKNYKPKACSFCQVRII